MDPNYVEDTFDHELSLFEPDSKLKQRMWRADDQSTIFRNRFPLERLRGLSQHEFGSEDGFCYWITKGTKDVAQYCSWDKIRLLGYESRNAFNKDGSAGRRIPVRWEDDYFEDHIMRPLFDLLQVPRQGDFRRNLRSEAFRRNYEEVARVFGQPVVLKIFLLYYPESFFNITRIEWLDRITFAFKLQRGETALETNCYFLDFYKRKLSVRWLKPLEFVEAIDRHIGLTSQGDDDFRLHLLDVKGYPPMSVAEICRLLRDMSRYVVANYTYSQVLPKIKSVDSLVAIRDSLWNDGIWLQHCQYGGCDSRYRRALELLIEYRGSQNAADLVSLPKRKPKSLAYENQIKTNAYAKDILSKLKDADTVSALVGYLCDLGQSHDRYNHYTILSSLLAIIGSKSFRLTRGDDPMMNDQWECLSCGNPSLWHRTFIISFASTAHENAAMWGLYSKPVNEAVRISCPKKSMVDLIQKIRNRTVCVKAEVESASNDKKPMQIDVPVESVEILLGDVLYGGDVLAGGGECQYRVVGGSLQKRDFKYLKDRSFHQDDEMTGFVKSIDWFYEEEVRIVVRIKESFRHPGVIDSTTDLLKIQHVYLPLPDGFLSSADYTLGPCVPDQLQTMFKDKICEKAGVMDVDVSKYSGKLKFRA